MARSASVGPIATASYATILLYTGSVKSALVLLFKVMLLSHELALMDDKLLIILFFSIFGRVRQSG